MSDKKGHSSPGLFGDINHQDLRGMWQPVFMALTTAPKYGLYEDSATSLSAETSSVERL